MMGDLSSHLAQTLMDERLLAARERRSLRTRPEPPERTAGADMDAHERQRGRVWASLLLSRRRDRPTHRRCA